MGQRFGLAHIETVFDDALGGGERRELRPRPGEEEPILPGAQIDLAGAGDPIDRALAVGRTPGPVVLPGDSTADRLGDREGTPREPVRKRKVFDLEAFVAEAEEAILVGPGPVVDHLHVVPADHELLRPGKGLVDDPPLRPGKVLRLVDDGEVEVERREGPLGVPRQHVREVEDALVLLVRLIGARETKEPVPL